LVASHRGLQFYLDALEKVDLAGSGQVTRIAQEGSPADLSTVPDILEETQVVHAGLGNVHLAVYTVQGGYQVQLVPNVILFVQSAVAFVTGGLEILSAHLGMVLPAQFADRDRHGIHDEDVLTQGKFAPIRPTSSEVLQARAFRLLL
jgi:hypothetical protein